MRNQLSKRLVLIDGPATAPVDNSLVEYVSIYTEEGVRVETLAQPTTTDDVVLDGYVGEDESENALVDEDTLNEALLKLETRIAALEAIEEA